LDNLPSLDAQFAGITRGVIRRDHRATSLSVPSYWSVKHAVRWNLSSHSP
jgi:hypothetical protein